MRGRSLLIAGLVCALFATPARAGTLGPPCPVGATLDVYVSMGATGCSVGPLNFRDFDFWAVFSSGGVSLIGPTDIVVNAVSGPSGPSLAFASSGFLVGPGQSVNYGLTYNIDPPPVIIRGFEEEMYTDTPVAPGRAQIATHLCVGGTYDPITHAAVGCGFISTLTVYHDGGPSPVLTASATWAPVNSLGVWHDIYLDASLGGSADFSGLRNDIGVVPEPAGWLLAGGGLLTLALRRRRRAA